MIVKLHCSWFIWNFEKMLQRTTGKCIYIPYWDSERDAQWEHESDVMHPATFGTWRGTDARGCTTNGITTWHAPFRQSPGINNGPSGCITRNFLPNFSFHGEAQVLATIANYNQFADTTGAARGNSQDNPTDLGLSNGFRIEFENGPHMLVHGIIAGHMGTNWSPSDPLFYLHHSNVDRIWTMWQDYWDHDTCHVDEYFAPWHFDSEWALDRTMPFEQAERVADWDFRMTYTESDSEQAYPTVRDVMKNDGPNFSVRYQNSYLNSLMPDYEANPRLFTVATDSVPIKCDRDEWEWGRKKRELGESREATFSNFFRSSLRGDDIEEIEGNHNVYFRSRGEGRVKNDLSGIGIHSRVDSVDIEEVTHGICGIPPVFTLQEDRDEWDRLCRELPANTTIAERLALMAESNCNRRGNPRSDAPEIKERISMTVMKDFNATSAAYECFHRPDKTTDRP